MLSRFGLCKERYLHVIHNNFRLIIKKKKNTEKKIALLFHYFLYTDMIFIWINSYFTNSHQSKSNKNYALFIHFQLCMQIKIDE